MTDKSTKVIEGDDPIPAVNTGDPGGSPFIFELPAVTETAGDYADADEAAADIEGDDLAGGIKVNSAPSGSQDDPAPPPEGDPDKYRGQLDASGNSYDPEKHLYPPEKTRTGRWRKIPRAKLEQMKASGESVPGETAANIRGEAQKLATLYGSAHLIPFGGGGAVKPPELVPLIDAYERYMNEHGVIETPSGLDAVLTSIAYSATVAQRPGNIERVKNWTGNLWAWIKEKRTGRKQKRADSKPEKQQSKRGDESTDAAPDREAPKQNDAPSKTDTKGPRFATTKDGDVIVPDVLNDLDRSV